MTSSTTPTLYQSAIIQDDKSQKHLAPTSTTVRQKGLVPIHTSHTPSPPPFSQPVAVTHAHVKYTTAHPFTPEFVQDHLTTNNSNKLRARALYDERVRRRQIALAERRSQASLRDKDKEERARVRARAKRKSGAGAGAGVAVKMGRREAAEKGVWRLRADEARYGDAHILSLSLSLSLSLPFFQIFFLFLF